MVVLGRILSIKRSDIAGHVVLHIGFENQVDPIPLFAHYEEVSVRGHKEDDPVIAKVRLEPVSSEYMAFMGKEIDTLDPNTLMLFGLERRD